MDGKAQYYEARRELQKLVGDSQFIEFFRGQNERNMKMAINILLEDLHEVAINRVPVVDNEKVEIVIVGSKIMLNTIMASRISPYLRDLASLYSLFVKNWCTNVKYNEDLMMIANAIELLVIQYASIMEAVDLLRLFIVKYDRLLNYVPPAFDVSKHFLEKVLDKQKC